MNYAALRLDVLVEELAICELKAVEDKSFSVTDGTCRVERGCQPVPAVYFTTGWQPRSTYN